MSQYYDGLKCGEGPRLGYLYIAYSCYTRDILEASKLVKKYYCTSQARVQARMQVQ